MQVDDEIGVRRMRQRTGRCLLSLRPVAKPEMVEMPQPRRVLRTGTDNAPVAYASASEPAPVQGKISGDASGKGDAEAARSYDYLDIPAFLRRQAD